jgi:hypothetical protein
LKKQAFGKKSGLFALAVVAALAVGCTGVYTRIPVLDEKETGAAPSQWERYGAYYIADDLIISTNTTPYPGRAVTEFTVYKKIRVLTTQRLFRDTVPMRRFTGRLALFECTIADSAGNRMPVPTSNLRLKYEESGTVVLPKVTPGSIIAIRMVFTQRYAPAAYEHWFTPQVIPVQTGRLVVHADSGMRFTFDHAVYGTRVLPQESAPIQYGGRTTCWKVTNLEPFDSLPYSPRISDSEPRVALRINPLYGINGNIISKWSEIAGTAERLVLDPALDNSEEEIAIKAAEITRGKKNDKTRAVAIVEWVQQNIVCGLEPVKSNVVDLLHGARSDLLLPSLLCRDLLKAAGVKADIILTRAHSRGGFDPDFLSYAGCKEGILVARFDSSDYAICPMFAGYPIGTYPADYFGLKGLNMDSYKIVTLPPPRWKQFDERSHITLSLSSDTAMQTMRQSFGELSLPPLRRRLQRHREGLQREVVEHLLHRRGDRNSLVSFSIQGLGDYDPEVSVVSRFRLSNPPVEMAGTLTYDLSQFLNNLYADIDSTRRQDIVTEAPVTSIDTLEILKENGMRVSLDAAAWQFADSLFDARIVVEQTPASVMFIRNVTTRGGCTVPQRMVGAIVNDIRELNRASRVVASVKFPARRKK